MMNESMTGENTASDAQAPQTHKTSWFGFGGGQPSQSGPAPHGGQNPLYAQSPPNAASNGWFGHGAGQASQSGQGTQYAQSKQNAAQEKKWVYCIPVPGFPVPEHQRTMKGWLRGILFLQLVACIARIFYLQDIMGGLWMGLTIFIGAHALYEKMDMTYICVWGLACLVNGFVDILGAILPLIFGILKFDFITTSVRLLIPFAYAVGACFAYHLYLDFAKYNNLETSMAVQYVPDVFAWMKSKVDRNTTDEETPLMYGQQAGQQPAAQQHLQQQQQQQQAPPSSGGLDGWIQGVGQSIGSSIGKGVAQGAQQEVQNQANQTFGRGGQSRPGPLQPAAQAPPQSSGSWWR